LHLESSIVQQERALERRLQRQREVPYGETDLSCRGALVACDGVSSGVLSGGGGSRDVEIHPDRLILRRGDDEWCRSQRRAGKAQACRGIGERNECVGIPADTQRLIGTTPVPTCR